MCAGVWGDQLILLGGVGLQTSPDIIVVNLTLQIWFGLSVSGVRRQNLKVLL